MFGTRKTRSREPCALSPARVLRVLLMGLAAGVTLLAGCKTEQMKSTPFYEGHDVAYTGAPEDRVNLWPLAYWREPVGSVLWPMFSFSGPLRDSSPLLALRFGAQLPLAVRPV